MHIAIGTTMAVALGSAASLAQAAMPPAASPGDLDGLWTNASYTRLQRPKTLKSLTLTPAEAKTYEATLRKYHGVAGNDKDAVGQNDSEFPDSGEGLARIRGQLRTSWIVDPSDGRVPYRPEAKARFHIGVPDTPANFENPEDRPQSERCISSNGSAPPQMSEQDANLIQIVQTKEHIALRSEKNHDVRDIRMNVTRSPNEPRSWTGDSIGRWEGKTLVVETEGFRQDVVDRDFVTFTGEARITERFTRISPSEILYEFTVIDPKTFLQPWRAEMLFQASKGPIYEYACHEGNYAMPSILKAARLGRQTFPPADPPKPAPIRTSTTAPTVAAK